MSVFREGVRLQQQLALSLFAGATPSQHAARAKGAAAILPAPQSATAAIADGEVFI
jgi:hypothetical protein